MTNWTEVKLGDIVERMTNGSSLNQHEKQSNGMLPITRIETIAFEEINLDRVKYVNANSDELERYGLLHGDILFSHINSDKHLGKTAIHKSSEKIIHGINLLLIRTNTDCNSFFLNYYFKYYRGLGKFIDIAQRAVNQSSINQKKLKDIKVLLPPLPEQKHIVAKLDTLFAHLDQLKARLQNIPTLLKQFRQAVLTQAVTGKLTEEWRVGKSLSSDDYLQEIIAKRQSLATKKKGKLSIELRKDLDLFELPKTWTWCDLEFLFDESDSFCYGVVQPGNNVDDEQKLIRVQDLDNGLVVTEQLRGISWKINTEYKRSIVKAGDLLITVVGTIGRTAIITDDQKGFNVARAVAKVPIKDFSSYYVKLFVDSKIGQSWLNDDSREVARKTLNLDQLRTLPIPIPPLEEQKEIVRRIKSLFDVADRIEASYHTLQEKIDHLPQAILSKAFRGELIKLKTNSNSNEN